MPGTVNLKVKDCPFDSDGELIVCGPLLVVTVWGASSWLVQVMLSPAVTVMACGANAKPAIWTLWLTAAAGTLPNRVLVRSPTPAEVAMPSTTTASVSNGRIGRGRHGFGRRGTNGRVIGSLPRP